MIKISEMLKMLNVKYFVKEKVRPLENLCEKLH